MNRNSAERIMELQEQIQSDFALMGEYKRHHAKFLEMLHSLSQDQQDILTNYLGVCIEIHLRMLEEAIT